jgi:mannosidase alpha-like ER degradation enhancer 2
MRTLLFFLASALLLLPPAFAQGLPAAQPSTAQPAKPPFSMTDAQKAEVAAHIRDETLRAWNGYKQYAWGHDSLKPLSKQPFDWYGPGHSLLMTPVDALDTLILMGLTPQADEARKLIDTQLNLNQDIYVKDFEITIRLLGSLISCYEMTGDKRLLELADELGRRMLPMFDSPTGMPYEYVNLRTGAVRGTSSNPAEIGSLLIEYGMLARLTGKQEYYDKAKRRGPALQSAFLGRPGGHGNRCRDRQMARPDRRHHGRHRFLL